MPEDLTGRLRPLKCQLAYLEKADGSCSYSQGDTTVWASCSGPGDVHISRRENYKMSLDVSYRTPSGEGGHNKLNSLLRAALESVVNTSLFPRTCLTVTVNVLEDLGSAKAVGITAAALALLDNGAPSRSIFCGVNVVRVDGKLVLDPDRRVEQKADASFLFVLQLTETNDVQLIGSQCLGSFQPAEYRQAQSLATEGSRQIFDFFKQIIFRKLSVEA